MKALSLKQPFAELIVSGKKAIELRTWNTKFRGKFFVHASGNTDFERCKIFGFNPDKMEKQAVVGNAELVSVVKYENRDELVKDKNKHLGVDFHSKYPVYGFILKNPKRVKPVKLKGTLGFFEVKQVV